MCGIWGYLDLLNTADQIKLFKSFMKIINRGPDRSDFKLINESTRAFLGFHRLAIMDRTTYGDQPFTIEHRSKTKNSSIYVMCNGEIYNHHELAKEYIIPTKSGSDCEILPELYLRYGFEEMIKMLKGEFAISVLDFNHDTNKFDLYLGRDALGVRPLFYGFDKIGFGFCSELKGLVGIVDSKEIKQLESGCFIRFTNNSVTRYRYFDLDIKESESLDLDTSLKIVKDKFEDIVISELESHRPLGALLSGGLDSSIVVSIASRHLKRKGKKLKTFSIGIDGATDKKYAEMVSEFCETDHTHVEFTNEEFLSAIPEVINATETYDITTVRASTGQYLISKWISENTDIKVLLIGDGSDELLGGYMYFHLAPSPKEHDIECKRLLKDLQYYDVLRADRCIAYNGLEARVPFLHKDLVKTILEIPVKYRIPLSDDKVKNPIEKYLLRKAFDDGTYLPDEVLFRKKEAFSDGVSSKNKSWYEIIQESIEDQYDDSVIGDKFPSKEAYHYRQIFNNLFCKDLDIIPYYWMPKWVDVKDPSARVLEVYK
jgi:asparagine synthase (glutamine-hydrolysing)